MLVRLAQIVDCPAGVEHGGVVLASTVQTNVRKGRFCHLLGEVHRDLTGLHNLTLPGFALELFNGKVKVIADHLLDVIDADFSGRVLDKLVNHVLCQVQSDGFAVQTGLGHQ